MQVAPHLVERCPFLLESDRLRLTPSLAFDLRRQMLLDELGIEHRLRPPASCPIRALADGCSVVGLRRLAAGHGIAERQLNELLGFLNSIGGLRRQRRPSTVPLALGSQLKHWFLSIHYTPLAWRRPATAALVLLGSFRATRPVTVAAALVGLLAAAGGVLSPIASGTVVGFGAGLFLASVFVHEVLHVEIAKNSGTPVALLQIGMRLGVIHRPLTARAELYSAAAGPVGGLVVGVLGAGIAGWYAPALGWLGVVIGLFHLGGLLPWYGDGISLRRALKGKP